MQDLHNLSDALYNIKEKLSSQEYLEIMNMLKALTLPLDNTVEGLMSKYKLDQNIAKFIFDCFEDPTFSNVFCYIGGDVIPSHMIFHDLSSDEEWSPARSHPYATRSNTRGT